MKLLNQIWFLLFLTVFLTSPTFAAKSKESDSNNIDKAAILVRYCSARQVHRYAGPGILSLKYQMWEKKRNVQGFIMEIDLKQTNFETIVKKLAEKNCI